MGVGAEVQPEDTDEDEVDMNINTAVYLRGWRRCSLSTDGWQPMRSVAVYLNSLLLQTQRCPAVHHLTLEPDGGALLAVTAAGCGVMVCKWGIEVSRKLAHVREQHRLLLKEEA